MKYPKLMVSKSGTIVLMLTDGEGVKVGSLDNKKPNLGRFIETWYMPNFSDFHGSVTIENEEDEDGF